MTVSAAAFATAGSRDSSAMAIDASCVSAPYPNAPAMPQQLDSTVSTFRPSMSAKRLLDCRHGCECLLVAVAVQQNVRLVPRDRPAMRPASVSRARNSSKRRACFARRSASATGQHREEFVAQGEQAGRLEPDDGHAAGDEGLRRIQHAPRLAAGLLDEPG